MLRVSDEVIRKATDFIVNNGLADVGFQYISIDDCWMRIDQDFYKNNKDFFEKRELDIDFQEVVGPSRDEYGRIIPNNFFPDMKGMTDYIHSFGLKAGLYSSPGERTCQRYAGSFGYEKIDAKQYADWGFDFLKYDMCSGWYISEAMKKALPKENSFVPEISFWYPMTLHLAEQDRDILYNLCQYGKQSPWEWAPNINIQTWRIRGDLLRNIDTYSDDALLIATDLREYSKPGQWSDPDYLYIDKTSNWKDKSAPPDDIPLSTNQKYQYVSLWSMICAPYFFSFSIDHANDFVIGLMGNADMANVNQDELGHVAEVVRDKNEQLVMAKKMADGAVVVGLFNMNPEEDQIARLKWDEIGLENRHFVRDLWRQKELGSVKEGITVKLSPNGCAILKVY